MRTFDDLLEYELGDVIQLFNAPRQNPRNNFETGTKGVIIEFLENGLMLETEKGEKIRTYLPFVCSKCENKAISIIKEDIEAGNSPFDADEVFHKEMKAYTDETLGISDIHKYSHRLFDAFEKLEFRTTFNKALQAFYLERGLYVVRSHSMGKYQYTLVKASSEEMAIRKCF